MGTTAYVGQGGIEILAKNIEAMQTHLHSLGSEYEGEDIEATCGNFGIELSFDNGGNITDAYPNTSNWSGEYEARFYEEIAPFVENGSFQTFYCDGFLFAYVYRGGEVEEISLDDVAHNIAKEPVVKCSDATCGKRMPVSRLPFRWPDPKVMDRVSPGDTVPLGLCPYCMGTVYQNETEE